MSYHGHFESQKQPGKPRKKKGKGLKIFLIVLAVLLENLYYVLNSELQPKI